MWATSDLMEAIAGKFMILIDTLRSPLADGADVVLPSCTWAEKAGTFVNRTGVAQAFEQAIPPLEGSRAEAQIALDLIAHATAQDRPERAYAAAGATDIFGSIVEIVDEGPGQVPAAVTVVRPRAAIYNAATARARMASECPALAELVAAVHPATVPVEQRASVEMVEL